MEDATNFNSETHKTHFITIMKEVGERVALKERKVLIPWEE